MRRVLQHLALGIGSLLLMGSPALANETITYTYDALGRLVAVESAGTVNNNQGTTVSYDAAGNRTSKATSGVSGPQISISNDTAMEGDELSFVVTLSQPSSAVVTVNYSVIAGSATQGTDYTAVAPGTITFSPGDTQEDVVVPALDDSLVEGDETLTVNLANVTGNASILDGSATGTITDADTLAELVVSDATVAEGGELVFAVSISRQTAGMVSFNFSVVPGTATAGVDFVPLTVTGAHWDGGVTSDEIVVETIDDSDLEADETLTVVISNPSGNITIVDGSGAGTIEDDESRGPAGVATLAIAAATVTEGGTLGFTVTRSGNTSVAASASYGTANGTASAGSDYTASSGTVNFAAGEISKTISVPTTDDSIVESAETLTVTLSNAGANTAINTATATGTINDNDVAQATLAIADASVVEGSALGFVITRSGNTSVAANANYATSNGTATAGSDYTAASGTVSFASGETTKTIAVATTNDSAIEAAETLTVTLSNPGANTAISDASGAGTINDNDTGLAIGNASVIEGGTLTFTVTRTGLTSGSSSASYATSNGTAIAGNDYTATSGTVSFSAGQTSKTISVSTANDSAVETSETLTVTLSSPSGATILTAAGTGTITDNDTGLAIGNASVTEGGSLSFTVTRSGVTTGSSSASYATSNGTATAGSDYTAASGTVSFSSGQTSKTITVATTNDSAVESTETLTVTLSSPTGATLVTASGTGTINDNDTAPITFAISDASATEGNNLTFTVTKSGTASTSLSVNYATSNGTASAGSDYNSTSGTLTFTTSQNSRTITVPTIENTTSESTETLTVTLSSPTSPATLSDATGTGTITDDDGVTSIQITDANLNIASAHQSTYNCSKDPYPEFGFQWMVCSLDSNGVTVFENLAPGQEVYDPGYSWSSGLRVLSSHYGTGQ